MKNAVKTGLSLLLVLVLVFSLAACGSAAKKEGLWETATYTQDQTFGEGQTTVEVEVIAGEESVTFTLKTDKETVGDALAEHQLIAGEEGPYGLYVKTVNGITADYDADKSFWSFNQNGEMMMTGVDSTKPENGAHYELVYTK